MHILSKVFVVFAAILSVLLSALTIAYASNSGRVVTEFRTEEARASSATAALGVERQGSSDRIGAMQLQIQALNDTIKGMQEQSTSLQRERAHLETEVQTAQSARVALENNISQFRETIETQTDLIAAFREELSTLRDNELAFRRQRLELEDRISDLESQNEVLTQANRGMQETIIELQRRLAEGGGSGNTDIERPVNGRVTSVSTDARTNRQFVEISLGTADGVRVGSRIEISRPGLYIADAEVTRVELQSCVATIAQTNRSGSTLQSGDTAKLLP